MKKRTFLKLSTTAMAIPLLSPLSVWATDAKLKNWAGNITYSTEKIENVKTITAAQNQIKSLKKVKALGTRHCFNTIADSKDAFVSLVDLPDDIVINKAENTVTVNSGIKYGQISPYLHEQGFALHNLASLPHISVAGACATATHGSGEKNGNLSSAVKGMELILANGEILSLTREKSGDRFLSSVVHLGALGVVTKVTLGIQPTFLMTQHVYENMPLDQLAINFDAVQASGYSVSLFSNWSSHDITEVWIKRKADDPRNQSVEKEWFGAKLATKNLHPIPELSAENCTEQMGVPGPWYERMPHFKMGFTPSSGVELQSEYYVPRKNAVEAILAISKLGKTITPYLLTSEVRTIAADDLWMSPSYQQDSVTIHFTWKQDWPAVGKLLPIIEKELAPFNARPHWGKLFAMRPNRIKFLYDRHEDFLERVKELDPKGKFKNDFLAKYLGY